MTEADDTVLVVANGPSSGEHTLASIQARYARRLRIARINHFYTVENYGNRIDDLFFSAQSEQLISNIYFAVSSSRFTIDRLLTPISRDKLGPLTFLDNVHIVNFWRYLMTDDRFAEYYMRGRTKKLPTSGLQIIHFYLTQGYRKFVVTGLDFYASETRYANFDLVTSKKIGDFKLSGYEIGAHSFQADLNYFIEIAQEYQFDIDVLCDARPWLLMRRVAKAFDLDYSRIRIAGLDPDDE